MDWALEFGLALPTSGTAASPEAMLRVAHDAERIGLAAVWSFERLLRPTQPVKYGTTEVSLPAYYGIVFDPLESLAYVAAGTSRIRLGTSVIDALFHSPVILGRRLATLDRLSHGRVIAGLGQGWMEQEFAVAGVSPKRRGAGFEEHIQAMRAVWGPDPVSFEGRFYRIPESEIGPKPAQPGGPPILAGATAPVAVKRAAAMGLGLNPGIATWQDMGDDLERIISMFREAAASRLPVVVRVNGSITEQAVADRRPLTGSAEQVAEDLLRLEALGVDHVFWHMDGDPAEHVGRMEQLLSLTARTLA
jgi:probable F420-dependent oxidoreductase